MLSLSKYSGDLWTVLFCKNPFTSFTNGGVAGHVGPRRLGWFGVAMPLARRTREAAGTPRPRHRHRVEMAGVDDGRNPTTLGQRDVTAASPRCVRRDTVPAMTSRPGKRPLEPFILWRASGFTNGGARFGVASGTSRARGTASRSPRGLHTKRQKLSGEEGLGRPPLPGLARPTVSFGG